MRACVTGGTGFVGAHVVRALAERGDDVRVVYRDANRLKALSGVQFRRAKSDVLDYKSMRRALRGIDVLFHVAGYVASSPVQRVWELNADGPVVAVEAAAAEGVGRVVLTSTISAIGTANGNGPADESTRYPDDWLGLAYPDSRRAPASAPRSRPPSATASTSSSSTLRMCWACPSTAGRGVTPLRERSPTTFAAAFRGCSTRR